MTNKKEKKGLFKIFGEKKKKGSGCCDFQIEEIPAENYDGNNKKKPTEDPAGDKENPSCCK